MNVSERMKDIEDLWARIPVTSDTIRIKDMYDRVIAKTECTDTEIDKLRAIYSKLDEVAGDVRDLVEGIG